MFIENIEELNILIKELDTLSQKLYDTFEKIKAFDPKINPKCISLSEKKRRKKNTFYVGQIIGKKN